MDNMNIRTDKRANQKIKWTAIGKLLIFAAVLLLPVGCVKDDLYNTPHPDKGAVKVTTDWSGRSSDAVLPDSYVLRIGDKEQTVSGETNAFSTLFAPGGQDLLVWHNAEGTTVGGTTATINTLPDGTLEPMPGYLFSAARELDIVKDDTLRVTVPMKQYIRRLVLTLKLNPGDELRISSTAATLTGIASATNLATGELVGSEGKTVIPAFALATDAYAPESRATGQPVLSATLHLMGVIIGERQMLTLEIMLTGGGVQTVSTDLTEMLKNFRTDDDKEPLVLDASLELPVEVEAGATITDWDVVDNGDIKVN
uniref:FimB/Mfa2 family fimbrial subunit n=1 Tax=uncultured Bacteroides sp. TaxID=162156 RepID=UPI0025E018F3|nr:FimB/Mfa2 family fimbrial subunit [uncultured Bacteroides sp.]